MPGGYSTVESYASDGEGVGSGMGPLADASPVRNGGGGSGGGGAGPGGGLHSSSSSPSSRSRLLSGLVSHAERAATVAARMKNTSTCIVVYVVLMLLNLFVMSVEVGGGGSHPVIILLECLINLFIIAEVAIGIYSSGRSYFTSLMNCVDFALAVLCVGFFLLLVATGGASEHSGILELDALLLACRFLFQVLRLSVLAYRSRQTIQLQNQEEVDFNAVSLEACVDSGGFARRTPTRASPVLHRTQSRSSRLGGMGHDDHELRVGLSTPDSGAGGRGAGIDGSGVGGGGDSVGSDGSAFTPTSYIHLKPSIFLELQNARAFADPPSVVIPVDALDSNEHAARQADDADLGSGGSSSGSNSELRTFTAGYGNPCPSPLGSPKVPVLTPPPSDPPLGDSQRSTPQLPAPDSPSASASAAAVAIDDASMDMGVGVGVYPPDSSMSASTGIGPHSSGSATRSLHPLLAHDSEGLDLDDEHLALQLL